LYYGSPISSKFVIAPQLGNLCEDNNSITSSLRIHTLILAKVLSDVTTNLGLIFFRIIVRIYGNNNINRNCAYFSILCVLALVFVSYYTTAKMTKQD
ncbi:hypothetical protein LC607_34845, partial [Nostoc sp. CHAB 5824]|nr:hypothetical protein [Nostoc sp. CHAB 5824]